HHWKSCERSASGGGELELLNLVPKLCLGTHLCETPVSRRRGDFKAVRETEFRGMAFPNRVWERENAKGGNALRGVPYLRAAATACRISAASGSPWYSASTPRQIASASSRLPWSRSSAACFRAARTGAQRSLLAACLFRSAIP